MALLETLHLFVLFYVLFMFLQCTTVSCFQSRAANSLASLLEQCAQRSPCPTPKIIKNLCNSLCCDPNVTPSATQPIGSLELLARQPGLGRVSSSGSLTGCLSSPGGSRPTSPLPGAITTAQCDKRLGILTLAKQQHVSSYCLFFTIH